MFLFFIVFKVRRLRTYEKGKKNYAKTGKNKFSWTRVFKEKTYQHYRHFQKLYQNKIIRISNS